ncbi:MAG TPA: cupin domain-containing protein [Terriglobales bacterium]|jgi:anti-sigma factor ChrR (cupin superfamily)|nr:cupin domain-containing protein [Terriglobales bacterium]
MKKRYMACIPSIVSLFLGISFVVVPAHGQSNAQAHALVRADQLKWSPSFMGCEHASVSGDPGADGKPFVLRIRCPDGAKVPPHWHPTDENITVLQGTFRIGTGEVFDSSKLTPMDTGSFMVMPKTMRHFALCKGETILQIHGIGPFKINWVNPAEVVPTNPQKEKPKS